MGDRYEAYSAGLEPKQISYLAFRVLAQCGIDITKQYSKTISVFFDQKFDYVISLCNESEAMFPRDFGGTERVEMIFPDPSQLSGTEKELLPHYQSLRDDMLKKLTEYFKCHSNNPDYDIICLIQQGQDLHAG